MHIKPNHFFTLYFPALLIDFAFSSILTNSSFYSSYLGLSSTFLGVLMAIATAFFTFLAIPFGKLSDRVERRRMLYVASLLLGIVSIGLTFCRDKIHLLIIFPGLGISMALFWPAYEAWLSDQESESKLIQRVTLFNLFWSAGVTLGPAASSYLYRDTTPFSPFYLSAALCLFTIVTLFLHKSDSASHTKETSSDTIQTLFPSPTVKTAYLNIARCANFASWFGLGVLRRLSPKLTFEMGILPKTYGNYMLMLGGVQTLVFFVLGTGFSTRWHYRLSPLLIVQGLAILSYITIWKVQASLLWTVAFAVIGLSAAFTYFSSLYYGLHKHDDKGNKSGWHEAILGMGILVGPLLGGIAADSGWGVQSPYLVCAVVVSTAILLEIFIVSKHRL